MAMGHRLRDSRGDFPKPSREEQVPVVIAGGGVAGLSAAWRLAKKTPVPFQLFELESSVGGNSAFGENSVSAYPWGAHYLPIPTPESHMICELLVELGVITGFDGQGRPRYHSQYLCHDPEERLLYKGHWQEDLQPHVAEEREELARFLELMSGYRGKRGPDGKRLFAIPLEESSHDPETRALDKISMAEFLKTHDFRSETLHWYVNYCCRDDFGATADRVSAWAGIHYFAARGGDPADSIDPFAVLTWPEGNGWLVKKMSERIGGGIQTGALITAIRQDGVDVFYPQKNETVRYRSEAVIVALPRFVAGRLMEEWRSTPPEDLKQFHYAPWMVANITLKGMPHSKRGDFPLAWDNVRYGGEMLGYVVATHQSLSPKTDTVLTLYWPLSHLEPKAARGEAYRRSHREWSTLAIRELEKMHPGIGPQVQNVDVCVWGHGMICPVPGFIWGEARQAALKNQGRIFFAHSDMSGISIFEEAHYRGVTAADQVLRLLRV